MEEKFDRFLKAYSAAWRSPRFAEVMALWDPDESEPWHFPEELEQPLIGREAIAAYLEAAAEAIGSFSVELGEAAIKALAPGLYTFRFAMRWRASMRGNALLARPIGARVRVSGVLRETDAGLRLVHYMEAGPAALPYLIAQYEASAAEPV